MADSLSISGRLVGKDFSQASQFEELTEDIRLKISVAAATSDVSVPLTGITAPKAVIVWGALGITVKINAEATGHPADPLFAESQTDGHTITALSVSNSDTEAHDVIILAAS